MTFHIDVNLSYEEYELVYDALNALDGVWANSVTANGRMAPMSQVQFATEKMKETQELRSKLEAKFQH